MKLGVKVSLAAVVGLLLVCSPAAADWDEGAPHKMHYPQLPKVQGGWDVMSSYYLFLADDWQCSASGPVTDFHVWVSYHGDDYFDPVMIHSAIWTNDPIGNAGIPGEDTQNTFSKPLAREWHKDWNSGTWTSRSWDAGDQGWFDPRDPAGYSPVGDHVEVYQLNFIIDPSEPLFYQQQGEIYWLEFTIHTPTESGIGWKESASPQFMDDAVWRIEGGPWNELVDPITGISMDLAFVITPEPATLALLAVGGAVVLLRRRRR